ncbi:unnamed protein product [marine sediment metagenome]|uniref:Uncharacterized protein n=1 Tax=marine sediment metagenome TaxID=412755 RepID=X1IJJ3_9ZZZZ
MMLAMLLDITGGEMKDNSKEKKQIKKSPIEGRWNIEDPKMIFRFKTPL